MHHTRHSNGQPSFLFRSVCAIVFSILIVESVATANTTTDPDPLASLLQTISSLFTTSETTSSTTLTESSPSDSTGGTGKNPSPNPPPPPPPNE